jgi:hypothetical protein
MSTVIGEPTSEEILHIASERKMTLARGHWYAPEKCAACAVGMYVLERLGERWAERVQEEAIDCFDDLSSELGVAPEFLEGMSDGFERSMAHPSFLPQTVGDDVDAYFAGYREGEEIAKEANPERCVNLPVVRPRP